MYISCSTLCWQEKEYPDLEAVLSKIRDMGFKAVDLAAYENWQNINPSMLASDHKKEWINKFCRLLEKYRLNLSSINTGFSRKILDTHDDAFEQYKQEFSAVLKLAMTAGCSCVTVQPGRKPEEGCNKEAFQTSVKRLGELGEIVKGTGVSVSAECHYGSLMEKPEDALQMLEILCPKVGFTYDPSHFVMQGIPLEDTIPLLKYTNHVHLRNASLGNMQDTCENGDVNFRWVVTALKDINYKGALAIEYFNGFDSDLTNTISLRNYLQGLGIEE